MMKTLMKISVSLLTLLCLSAYCQAQPIPNSFYSYMQRVNDSITTRNTRQREISPLNIGHRLTELANLGIQLYDSTAIGYLYGLKKEGLSVRVDTTRIADKTYLQAFVKYSDTAAMLSPYLRSADTTGRWQPLGSYIQSSQVGDANGICPLGANGTVPLNYFPSTILGSVKYQGSWNATTGVTSSGDTLHSGVGIKGDYFVVTTAGSITIDGNTGWHIKDWIVYNGATWDKIDNTETVTAVNGNTGDVHIGLSGVTAAGSATADAITTGGYTATYGTDYVKLLPHQNGYPGLEFFSSGNYDNQIALNSSGWFTFLNNGNYAPVSTGIATVNGILTIGGGGGIYLKGTGNNYICYTQTGSADRGSVGFPAGAASYNVYLGGNGTFGSGTLASSTTSSLTTSYVPFLANSAFYLTPTAAAGNYKIAVVDNGNNQVKTIAQLPQSAVAGMADSIKTGSVTIADNGTGGVHITDANSSTKADVVTLTSNSAVGTLNLYQPGMSGIALSIRGNSVYSNEGSEYYTNSDGNVISQLGTGTYTDGNGNTSESGSLAISDNTGNNNVIVDGRTGNISAHSLSPSVMVEGGGSYNFTSANYTVVYNGGSNASIMLVTDGDDAIINGQVIVIKNMSDHELIIDNAADDIVIDNGGAFELQSNAVITLQKGTASNNDFYIIGYAENLARK